MTYEQYCELEEHFARSHNWTQSEITSIAASVAMERTKVYKWLWDRKRKELRAQQTAR